MKLFNIIYNDVLATIKGHFGTVHSVAFHPDGHSFASGAEDGYVHYHRMLPEYFTKRFEWKKCNLNKSDFFPISIIYLR